MADRWFLEGSSSEHACALHPALLLLVLRAVVWLEEEERSEGR